MKEPIFYRLIRPILYLYITKKYNIEIINKHNIPLSGRCVLAGNHTNNMDPMILGSSTNRCVRFIAKDELCKGLKGILFKWMGIIPVNRKIHDKSVIPTCKKYLEKEAILGIFPEGTINRTNDIIMPFKKGAVVMAKETNSIIVPFAIDGNYNTGKVKIIFGKPYNVKSDDMEKETEILEDKVIELIKIVKESK